MKVVYVTSESYIDHGYTIIKELKKHIDMPVYLQAKGKTNEIIEWCSKFKAEFILRKRFRNPFSIFTEIRLLRRIKKQNPDLVWFNGLTVYQIFLVKFFIKNFLVIMHDVELHPGNADKHGSLSVKLTLKYLKKYICVVSHTQAQLFEDQYGVYPPVFQLPAIDYYKDCARGALIHRTGGNVKFFFFGSVEAYKGIELLIEACSILRKKSLPEYEVTVYGKLKYNTAELAKQLEENNITLINKFIDYRDVHKLYNENDVIILPYRQVTQCGPLLIGFSENVPAICSSQEGFIEYVNDNISGLLFDNSAESLAEKMEQIITNPSMIQELKGGIMDLSLSKFGMEYLYSDYINGFKKAASRQ